MQPDMTPDGIVELLRRNDWREDLARLDTQSSQRLLESYQRLSPRILSEANRLVQGIVAAGESTPAQLRRLQEYTDFLAVVNTEMDDFSRVILQVAQDASDDAIIAGLNGADRMVSLQIQGQSTWARPAFRTVREAVSIVDSPAFRAGIREFGDNAELTIADLILSGVAQGRNPRQIGAMISEWTNTPLYWGQSMARTSMIYSARRSSQYAYQQNPRVVTDMMWSSAKDDRTCMSCWSMDGMIFPVTATFGDHHQGRCTWLPLVRGRNWWRDYPLGQDRFEQLPEDRQRQIMGNNALFEAWQNGEVRWEDFSREYENDVYGTMRTQASLAYIRRRRA